MGLTAAKTSLSDTRLFQQTINQLGLIQLDLISKEDQIKKDMQNKGIELCQELIFELVDFDMENLYLVDKIHEYKIVVKHA